MKYLYGLLILLLFAVPGLCESHDYQLTNGFCMNIDRLYNSEGLFACSISLDPTTNTYADITKVEFSVQSCPSDYLWTAWRPELPLYPDIEINWTTEVRRSPDTGMTSFIWTTNDEPIRIDPTNSYCWFWMQTTPWGIPTDWCSVSVWGPNGAIYENIPFPGFGTVPEPGSLVALGLGLVPMAGFALRKRRK